MAKDYFVVDIGETYTKIGDIHVTGNKFVADALGMVVTDELFFKSDTETSIQKLGDGIKKVVEQLHIKKRAVHVILPDAHTFSRFVEMPKLNEKELLSAIKYQADQFIPMPLDETNIDIEVVHENQKDNKLLALISAAPKKLIQRVEILVEQIGLIPEAIETEISAVARVSSQLFRKNTSGTGKPAVMLINMGHNSTTVYCFDQSTGILNYNHVFNIGTSLFLKEIQINLNVPANKADELLKTVGVSKNASYSLEAILAPAMKDFLTEIQKAVNVMNSTYGLTLVGGFTMQDSLRFFEIDKLLSKAFGIPITTLDMYPYFEKGTMVDFFKNQLPYFITTVGGNLV